MGEIIENKNSLTYPVQIGDQKIVVPDNTSFKKFGLSDLEHYYITRITEVKEEYERLIDDYNTNRRIYESKFRFEPVIGHIYHLYEDNSGNEFLSLIGPNEWKMKHIGSFKYGSDKRWLKT